MFIWNNTTNGVLSRTGKYSDLLSLRVKRRNYKVGINLPSELASFYDTLSWVIRTQGHVKFRPRPQAPKKILKTTVFEGLKDLHTTDAIFSDIVEPTIIRPTIVPQQIDEFFVDYTDYIPPVSISPAKVRSIRKFAENNGHKDYWEHFSLLCTPLITRPATNPTTESTPSYKVEGFGDIIAGKLVSGAVAPQMTKFADVAEQLDAMTSKLGPLLDQVDAGIGQTLKEILEVAKATIKHHNDDPGSSLTNSLDRISRGITISPAPSQTISVLETIILIVASIYLYLTFTDWKQSCALIAILASSYGVGSRILTWFEDNKRVLEELDGIGAFLSHALRGEGFPGNPHSQKKRPPPPTPINIFDFVSEEVAVDPLSAEYLSTLNSANITPSAPDYKPEGVEESFENYGVTLAKILSTGIVSIMSTGDTRKLPKFFKMGQYASAFNSINTMSGFVKTSLDVAGQMLWETHTGLPSGALELDDFAMQVDEWLEAVLKTAGDMEWMRDFITNEEKHTMVIELTKLGNDLLVLIKNLTSQERNSVVIPINLALRQLAKCSTILEMIQSQPILRVEPVSINIVGGTGLGKTAMIHQLAIDLLSVMPPSVREKHSELGNLVHTRDPSGEYHDGYNGQFMFFIDEILQSKTTEDEIADAMLIFKFVNTHPTPMNMAAAPLKNKIAFSSPFLVSTSNIKNWDCVQVRSKDALKRRRGIIIEPKVLAKFSQQSHPTRVNTVAWFKFAQANKINPSRPEYAEFDIIDNDDQSTVVATLTYQELLDFIISEYDRKQDVFGHLNFHKQKSFEAAVLGQAYVIQGDKKLTVTEILAKIKSQKDNKSSKYMSEETYPFQVVSSQLKDIADHTQLEGVGYKKIEDAWKAFSTDEKVETVLVVTALASCKNFKLKQCIYKTMFTLDDFDIGVLAHGDRWKELKQNSKEFKFTMHDYRSKIKSFFSTLQASFPWKEVLAVFVSLSTAAAVVGLIYHLTHKGEKKTTCNDGVQYESYTHSKGARSKFGKKTKTNAESLQEDVVKEVVNNITVTSLLPEAILDNQLEDIRPKIIKNLCRLELMKDGVKLNRSRGIVLQNDFLLVPRHLFESVVDQTTTYLKVFRPIGTITVLMSDLHMVDIGERWKYNDATVIKFPPSKLIASSIVKFFISKEEACDLDDVFGELIVIDDNEIVRHSSLIRSQTQYLRTNPTCNVNIGERRAVVGWHYLAATKNGDCGSPLIQQNSSSNGKIIGMHAAGSNSIYKDVGCFSQVIDREFLEIAMGKLGLPPYKIESDEVGRDFYGVSHLYKQPMDLVSYVSNKYAVHTPIAPTKIRSSDFSGVLAYPSTKPVTASLRVGGSLDKVLDKFQFETPYVDRHLVDTLTKTYYYKIGLFSDKFSRDILSWDVVIKGIDDLGSINPHTSMGYPYVLNRLKKQDILELNLDGYTLKVDTDFYKELMETEINLSHKLMKDWIWVTYLKDERVPKEKADAGKIRMFMSCPFDLTILCRRYFGSFMDAIHQTKFKNGCMVGINGLGYDWDVLAKELLNHNDLICTEDFQNWDRTVPKEFLEVFFKLAKLFYNEHYTHTHEALQAAILDPTFQTGFFRYRVASSNPSGSPFTSEMNSISNIIITLYCLVRMGFTLNQVFDQTYIAAYGDDKAWTANFDFDMEEYVQQLTSLGLKVTSTKKDGTLPQLLSIDQIDFLQRRFVVVYGQYRGQLKQSIIEESLLWVSGKSNQHEALTDTIRTVFVELEQYLPKEVEELYRRILQCCSRYDYEFPITEHLVSSLASKQESWSGTNFEHILLQLGGSFWNQSVSIKKLPCSLEDIESLKGRQAYYVGVDLARSLPIITNDIYYHTGFRFSGVTKELVFSNDGVVWIEISYEPHFSYDISLNLNTVANSIGNTPKYHKIKWNCIAWAEQMMVNSNQIPPLPLHERLVQYTLKNYPSMYKVEADNDTLSEKISDAEVVSSTVSQVVLGQVMENYAPGDTRSFKSLMETNELIKQGKWSQEGLDTELFAIEFPKQLLSVSQFKSKLKYNALFSANIHVTLKVSSTRFQSGQLLLVWEPLGQYGMPGGVDLHTWAFTAMPHVIYNAAVQNEVSLILPYISPFNFVRLQGADPKFGILRLKVLNPLRDVSASKSATYSLYANFVDVITMGPTPINKITPMRSTDVYPNFFVQGDSEAEVKSTKGLISSIASGVSSTARLIGKIPIFSSAAAVVSSVSDTVETVATYLGLSKPNSLQSTMPTIPRPFSCVSYKDGLDMSQVIGVSATNHVVIQPGLFGSTVDEMSIQYICKTPQIVDVFEWDTATPANTILRTYPVVPTIGSKVPRDAIQISPMGYVAMGAKFWRGSIQFKFQIVATGFHQGVLAIGFIPLGCAKEFSLSATSHVRLDLGVTDSIEFTAPFVSDRMYNIVPNLFSSFNMADAVASGSVLVKVLNPLVAPDTVDRTIEINLWIAAGDDFEIAVPTLDAISMYQYGYKNIKMEAYVFNMSSDDSDSDSSYEIEAGGDLTMNQRSREDWQLKPAADCLRGYYVGSQNPNNIVVGESLLNLRDILKIFCKKFKATTPAQSRQLCFNIPAHSYVEADAKLEDTYYDHYTRMYRVSRGSIRHKILTCVFDGKMSVILNLDATEPSYNWHVDKLVKEGDPYALCVPALNPTLEYVIPFYSKEKLQVHGPYASARGVTLTFEPLGKLVDYNIIGYEAIGDDFSMGYLTGPPTLRLRPRPDTNFLFALREAWESGTSIQDHTPIDTLHQLAMYTSEPTEIHIGNIPLAYAVATQYVFSTFVPKQMLYITTKGLETIACDMVIKTIRATGFPDSMYLFTFIDTPTKGPTSGKTESVIYDWGEAESYLEGAWFFVKVRSENMKICLLSDKRHYKITEAKINYGRVLKNQLAAILGPGDGKLRSNYIHV